MSSWRRIQNGRAPHGNRRPFTVEPDEIPTFLAVMLPFAAVTCCGVVAVVRLINGDLAGAMVPGSFLIAGFFGLLVAMVVFRS